MTPPTPNNTFRTKTFSPLQCRDQVAKFKNTELCRLTEQVIFTDPYYAAPVNRHTSPFLDDVAQQFRQDVAAKAAAAELKVRSYADKWTPGAAHLPRVGMAASWWLCGCEQARHLAGSTAIGMSGTQPSRSMLGHLACPCGGYLLLQGVPGGALLTDLAMGKHEYSMKTLWSWQYLPQAGWWCDFLSGAVAAEQHASEQMHARWSVDDPAENSLLQLPDSRRHLCRMPGICHGAKWQSCRASLCGAATQPSSQQRRSCAVLSQRLTNSHCRHPLHALKPSSASTSPTPTQPPHAAVTLQAKFVERAQALLHGDLHTGSLMCTQETTYMIDAEFAFYGPMAFDVQKMLANLLIAYFASFGLETADKPRDGQRAWMLQVHGLISAQLTLLACRRSWCAFAWAASGGRMREWECLRSVVSCGVTGLCG